MNEKEKILSIIKGVSCYRKEIDFHSACIVRDEQGEYILQLLSSGYDISYGYTPIPEFVFISLEECIEKTKGKNIDMNLYVNLSIGELKKNILIMSLIIFFKNSKKRNKYY